MKRKFKIYKEMQENILVELYEGEGEQEKKIGGAYFLPKSYLEAKEFGREFLKTGRIRVLLYWEASE